MPFLSNENQIAEVLINYRENLDANIQQDSGYPILDTQLTPDMQFSISNSNSSQNSFPNFTVNLEYQGDMTTDQKTLYECLKRYQLHVDEEESHFQIVKLITYQDVAEELNFQNLVVIQKLLTDLQLIGAISISNYHLIKERMTIPTIPSVEALTQTVFQLIESKFEIAKEMIIEKTKLSDCENAISQLKINYSLTVNGDPSLKNESSRKAALESFISKDLGIQELIEQTHGIKRLLELMSIEMTRIQDLLGFNQTLIKIVGGTNERNS